MSSSFKTTNIEMTAEGMVLVERTKLPGLGQMETDVERQGSARIYIEPVPGVPTKVVLASAQLLANAFGPGIYLRELHVAPEAPK